MSQILSLRNSMMGTILVLSAMVPAISLRAVDIASYGIIKQQNFVQTNATSTAPSVISPFQGTIFMEPADFTAIVSASIRRPGSLADEPLRDTDNFTLTESFASQSQLNAKFSSGQYRFTFDTVNDDLSVVQLNVPADAFGATPRIVNFSALQSVAANADFNLQWIPFTEGTANDFIQVRIFDSFNFPVFETGYLGEPDALSGTATNVVIPGGTFEIGSTYIAYLSFGKIAVSDTAAYPGAVGRVVFVKETQFTLMAVIGSESGPTLLFTNPQNGATQVPTAAGLMIFVFSKPMMPSQAISWTGVNAASFQYAWPQPNTLSVTFTGALPSGTTIGYVLNPPDRPPGFKDVDGQALAPTAGSFTTAGSPTSDPCSGSADGRGSFVATKSVNYVQSNQSAPSFDATLGAIFSAFVQSPVTNPVTAASLKLPSGTTVTLTNLFGRSFAFFRTFSSQAAMDAEFSAGTYTLTVTRTGAGTQTATIVLGSTEPPLPQLANFSELNTFNSTLDTVARWNAFTGAAPNDGISISLQGAQGGEFHAPDPCVPRTLTNTATSVTVPKNTLAANGPIDGQLTFSKISGQSVTLSDLPGQAGLVKTTRFSLRSGSSSGALRLGQPVRQANGSFLIGVTGQANSSCVIEASFDLKTWATFTNVTLSSAGSGEFTAATSATPSFFRARSGP